MAITQLPRLREIFVYPFPQTPQEAHFWKELTYWNMVGLVNLKPGSLCQIRRVFQMVEAWAEDERVYPILQLSLGY